MKAARTMSYGIVATLCGAVVMLAGREAHADVNVIAVAGDHAPDGNGVFSAFGAPTLNDAGQAAFFAGLVGTSGGGTDNAGIFIGNSVTLSQVVRRGQMIPDGSGSFSTLALDPSSSTPPSVNSAGQAAFLSFFSRTGGQVGRGIFRSAGSSGPLAQIVLDSQAAPDGDGIFATTIGTPSLNDSGQVAFFSALTGTATRLGAEGIFRGDGASLTQIVRGGQSAPDSNGTYFFSAGTTAQQPVLNNDGLVALAANLMTQAVPSGSGIILADGVTQTVVAHSNAPTPDGAGTFTSFTMPVLNNTGLLAFSAVVNGPTGAFNSLYLRSGTTLAELSRLRSLSTSINDAAQLAVISVDLATGGILRINASPESQMVVVAPHQVSPDGNGLLALLVGSTPSPLTINNSGQIAFASLVAGGSPGIFNDTGIYLYDPVVGLVQAARTGNSFLGSTITALTFQSGGAAHGSNGLNNSGEVAFGFRLQDGRTGIAVGSNLTSFPTRTPTASPTLTPTSTTTATRTPTRACAGRNCPTPTPTPTVCDGNCSATPTRTPLVCTGDCDGSADVTVNEILQLANFVLGVGTDCSTCLSGIPAGVNCPGDVTVAVIIQAVSNALNGCPAPPSPTPTRVSR